MYGTARILTIWLGSQRLNMNILGTQLNLKRLITRTYPSLLNIDE